MSIVLAIPCFNEAERLPGYLPALLDQIVLSGLPVTVEVVDDGSIEEERLVMGHLVDNLRTRYPLLRALRSLPANRGKGGAVHAAWGAACETHDYLAFVDADGSLSPSETCRFLHECVNGPHNQSWFASRIQMLGRQVDRHFSRHLMGRVFATLVGNLIDDRVYDSQCGLKALPSSHYRIIRPYLTETRFAFDVELLAALDHAGLEVREMPVDWADVAGSKVKPIRDTISMFRALIRIRRHRRGWPSVNL